VPCAFVSGSGQVRYRLGDRYLEFVAGLPPSNTDSRRGRAWSVTSHRVLVASQGGPPVTLTRMR
jgi:hypothetical protein